MLKGIGEDNSAGITRIGRAYFAAASGAFSKKLFYWNKVAGTGHLERTCMDYCAVGADDWVVSVSPTAGAPSLGAELWGATLSFPCEAPSG